MSAVAKAAAGLEIPMCCLRWTLLLGSTQDQERRTVQKAMISHSIMCPTPAYRARILSPDEDREIVLAHVEVMFDVWR